VIPSFKTHQHINPREKLSTLDAPSEEDFTRAPRVATRHWPDSDGAFTRREEGKGKEGKGKEGKGRESSSSADADGDEDDPESAKRPADPEDEKCARWLYGRQLDTNPDAKKPNFATWARHIRLMRERDGRTHRQICELFAWAKDDDFWSANIQSPEKLRKQWDTLTEQRMRPQRQQQGRPPTMTPMEATLAAAERAKAFLFPEGQEEGENHATS
jgi:hypothetical protein